MTTKAVAYKAPTAAALLAVLTQHQSKLNGEWDYAHIKPFNLNEVQDFLDGKKGAPYENDQFNYGRSHQIKQALASIGARLIDKNKADDKTFAAYKGVWSIQNTDKCPYCAKNFKFHLMMGNPRHCNKARCILMAMGDRM